MISAERRKKILAHIRSHGSAKVEDFVQKYAVSSVTIRNDLNILEKEGCIFRCYGGASINPNFVFDQPFYRKDKINRSTKELIAKAAAKLINDGDAIILDAGSTIGLMPPFIATKKQLTVITNALNTASQLSRLDNIDLHVIGGNLRRSSCSLVGYQAEQQIRLYSVDKLFLGVDGFDLLAGITTSDSQEAQINRTMCDVARKIIAVTDSSKFGRKSFCTIRAASQIDLLITDSNIPSAIYQKLVEMGLQIIIAD